MANWHSISKVIDLDVNRHDLITFSKKKKVNQINFLKKQLSKS